MRIQHYLAMCGVASRRKSEELVVSGRVEINGLIVSKPGTKVEPGKDIVKVDGKQVLPQNKKIYIMINKPKGYVSTVKDQFGRPAVLDLLKGIKELEGSRLYPVGRLDYDTTGLLILTNDGDFTYRVTHPSHNVDKVYIAKVRGVPDEEDILAVRNGIDLGDYVTGPGELIILSKEGAASTVKVIIHEGRNRQVRKMLDSLGHKVIELKRIAIGMLELGSLKECQWRHLSKSEIFGVFGKYKSEQCGT